MFNSALFSFQQFCSTVWRLCVQTSFHRVREPLSVSTNVNLTSSAKSQLCQERSEHSRRVQHARRPAWKRWVASKSSQAAIYHRIQRQWSLTSITTAVRLCRVRLRHPIWHGSAYIVAVYRNWSRRRWMFRIIQWVFVRFVCCGDQV